MAKSKPAAKPQGKAQDKAQDRAEAGARPAAHAEIRPGQSIELLKELHILTRDGQLTRTAGAS